LSRIKPLKLTAQVNAIEWAEWLDLSCRIGAVIVEPALLGSEILPDYG
jgi:hypothetical protein